MKDFTSFIEKISVAIVAVLSVVAAYLGLKKKRQEAEPPHITATSDKPRILIVDDNREFLQSVRSLLNGDYSVREFEFPHDALRKVIEWHEEGRTIDVAIIDYGIPKLNGRQIVGIIRVLYPRTPIVFLSGAALALNHEDRKMVDEVWAKPHDALRIRQKIAGLLK